jgi:hypothetical protein
MEEKNKIPDNWYVDNDRLLKELTIHLREYRKAVKAGLTPPPVTPYIGECFLNIAYGLAKLNSYSGYSFKHEMISDAIENCVMYYHNFNPRKYKNPFGYFSQFCRWAFHRRIAKEARQQYVKYKLAANSGLLDDETLTDSDGNAITNAGVFDNISDFIKNYEAKMAEKKSKKTPKVRKHHVARKTGPASTNRRPNKKRRKSKRSRS